MTPPRILRLLIVLLWLGVSAGAATDAQPLPGPGAPDDPPAEELREAIRDYFHTRLRVELALTDEQMLEIVPRVERMERSRTAARRERIQAVRQLRRGLHEGAGDAELQALLDRVERIERDQRQLEREELREIDAMLSVRQRVQLRLFIDSFRRELQQRVQQLRGGEGPPRRFGPRPRRR